MSSRVLTGFFTVVMVPGKMGMQVKYMRIRKLLWLEFLIELVCRPRS